LSSLLKIPVSAFLFFLSLNASAGDPFRPSAGAGEAGMGYVCIMKNSFWSAFHNQATLADNNTYSFGFNYENRFLIKDLGTRSAALTIPAGKASIGAVYSHFGNNDFKRDMTGLACGMHLSDMIDAGVQIDYLSERTFGEYSNIQLLTCETGLIITPSEKTRIGIHLLNPVPNSIRKISLPTTLRAGVGINLSKLLFAAVEAEMSTKSKLNIKTGFEYDAGKKVWLRGGFRTADNAFSFGLGYLLKISQIDIGFVTHEKLGVTSSVSMIFKIR